MKLTNRNTLLVRLKKHNRRALIHISLITTEEKNIYLLIQTDEPSYLRSKSVEKIILTFITTSNGQNELQYRFTNINIMQDFISILTQLPLENLVFFEDHQYFGNDLLETLQLVQRETQFHIHSQSLLLNVQPRLKEYFLKTKFSYTLGQSVRPLIQLCQN